MGRGVALAARPNLAAGGSAEQSTHTGLRSEDISFDSAEERYGGDGRSAGELRRACVVPGPALPREPRSVGHARRHGYSGAARLPRMAGIAAAGEWPRGAGARAGCRRRRPMGGCGSYMRHVARE